MGGGQRNQRQQAAQNVGSSALNTEQQSAIDLNNQLQQQQAVYTNPNTGYAPAMANTYNTANTLALTGGIDPSRTGYQTYVNAQGPTGGLDESKTGLGTYADMTNPTGGYNENKTGYNTYTNMAVTGGYDQPQKDQFIRSATLGNTAMYSNLQDQLNRNQALQGGYSPGFDASTAALTRNAAESGGEAALRANVELNQQINANKLAGAAGQTGVQQMEQQARQAGAAGMTGIGEQEQQGRLAGAAGATGIEQIKQQGQIAGQDALQRYTTQGLAALNQNDIQQLQNRMQNGQMSMSDAQLLTNLANQDPTAFQNIMSGFKTIGGAAAGAMGGLGQIGVNV